MSLIDEKKLMTWAFGENYGTMPMINWVNEWNNRHGDIFRIGMYDNVFDTMKKIEDIYKNTVKLG